LVQGWKVLVQKNDDGIVGTTDLLDDSLGELLDLSFETYRRSSGPDAGLGVPSTAVEATHW
jgi:hypothetical protein